MRTSGKKSEKELRSMRSESDIKEKDHKKDKDDEKVFEEFLNKKLTKLEENRAKSVDRDSTLKKLGKDLGVVEEEIDDDENDAAERRSIDLNPNSNLDH
jgi:Na+/H+-translocating membrane pyrophosphatase